MFKQNTYGAEFVQLCVKFLYFFILRMNSFSNLLGGIKAWSQIDGIASEFQ